MHRSWCVLLMQLYVEKRELVMLKYGCKLTA